MLQSVLADRIIKNLLLCRAQPVLYCFVAEHRFLFAGMGNKYNGEGRKHKPIWAP